MAATTTRGFPYPQATDPVDVPSDIYNLANKIDTLLTDTAVAITIPLRGTGGVVTVGTPTSGSHAVTKTYADAITTAMTSLIQTTVPLTTAGDILYASGSGLPVGTMARLGIGSSGYVLTVAGGVPTWSNPSYGAGQGSGLGYTQTSGSISVNTATTIATEAMSGFTAIQYMLTLKQGTKVRFSTIHVVTDGSTAVSSEEYGITEIGSMSGVSVLASISSTNSILQVTVTDASTTNVTWKLSKISL
jgi:hypothetical protein